MTATREAARTRPSHAVRRRSDRIDAHDRVGGRRRPDRRAPVRLRALGVRRAEAAGLRGAHRGRVPPHLVGAERGERLRRRPRQAVVVPDAGMGTAPRRCPADHAGAGAGPGPAAAARDPPVPHVRVRDPRRDRRRPRDVRVAGRDRRRGPVGDPSRDRQSRPGPAIAPQSRHRRRAHRRLRGVGPVRVEHLAARRRVDDRRDRGAAPRRDRAPPRRRAAGAHGRADGRRRRAGAARTPEHPSDRAGGGGGADRLRCAGGGDPCRVARGLGRRALSGPQRRRRGRVHAHRRCTAAQRRSALPQLPGGALQAPGRPTSLLVAASRHRARGARGVCGPRRRRQDTAGPGGVDGGDRRHAHRLRPRRRVHGRPGRRVGDRRRRARRHLDADPVTPPPSHRAS